MAAKIQEAEECVRQAEKSLKTSLLRWKPEYDVAAAEYTKAAIAYKAGKDLHKSFDCHVKAAENFRTNKSYYSAAKAYESAGLLCGKDLNQYEKAIGLFEKSCAMFREHGVPDTAALSLDRGAKMIEPKFPEKAAEFYAQAADITMIENKTHQAAEFAGKSARIYLKLKRLDDAISMINRMLELLMEGGDERSSGRVVVYQVLVHLARDDFVSAKKCFNEGMSFVDQQEIATLSVLLEAYDDMDSKKIIYALNSPFIKALDNEYAKLARSLQQKHGANIPVTPNHQASSDTGETNEAEVDDEAGALL